MAETVTTSATDFKRHVGKYLDVARTGAVIIEKQGRPTAVLISVEEYEALNPSASRVIDRLTEEFDTLVAPRRGHAAAPRTKPGALAHRRERDRLGRGSPATRSVDLEP